MNLKLYREKNNIPENVRVIDAESVLLSLLLRNKAFGYALNEEGLAAYQNAVVNYFVSKNIPAVFTFLSEDNNRLIEEKALGLKEDVMIELSLDEIDAINDEAKQSPCINICKDGSYFLYQLDPAIIAERYQPDIYNAAIKKWSGNSYYSYLLEKLAPECTIDRATRNHLTACGQEFCTETFPRNEFRYLESYVTRQSDRLHADEQARDPEEAKAVRFFETTQKHVTPIIQDYTPV